MLTEATHILKRKEAEIEAWFEEKWKGFKPTLYLSCDIRHSGFKISIVDTNLFPSGFNNLCPSFSKTASLAFKNYLNEYFPSVKKIVIYGEEHTRNKFYLKNLLHLEKLLTNAGFEVLTGLMADFLPGEKLSVDFEAETLNLFKLGRVDHQIFINNDNFINVDKVHKVDKVEKRFVPDLILSNNDFTGGLPTLLNGIDQPVIPLPSLGWHQRTKKDHFKVLKDLFVEFGEVFGIDPWLLNPITSSVSVADLSETESLKIVSQKIDDILKQIHIKYIEYKVKDTPYVYLKNQSGTYGMGLITLFQGSDILSLNSRMRNKLFTSKGGAPISGYVIQEGIPTADFYSSYPIEPVIYAVGKKEVGGFFRIHESKNEYESLNAPGMTFACLCLHKLTEPHEEFFLQCRQKEEVVYLSHFLTRIACLATAIEAQHLAQLSHFMPEKQI